MGVYSLTLLLSERPKLYAILAFLSAVGLRTEFAHEGADSFLEGVTFMIKGEAKMERTELLPLKVYSFSKTHTCQLSGILESAIACKTPV